MEGGTINSTSPYPGALLKGVKHYWRGALLEAVRYYCAVFNALVALLQIIQLPQTLLQAVQHVGDLKVGKTVNPETIPRHTIVSTSHYPGVLFEESINHLSDLTASDNCSSVTQQYLLNLRIRQYTL